MGSYDGWARCYDALYAATGKDYGAEANAVLGLLGEHGVRPRSLLDVACGTGQHLAVFRTAVDEIVGLDAAPAMLEVAKERLPGVTLRRGDMRTLDLGRTFDVVTCLFSSIGHVRDAGDLDAAVIAMAKHVAPGGMLVIEPWLTPDAVHPDGHRGLDTARMEDGWVARASRSALRGEVLVVEFAWARSTTDGVSTEEEAFRMPLFTQERYLAAVTAAGLEASWTTLPALRAGRGLLLGRRPLPTS